MTAIELDGLTKRYPGQYRIPGVRDGTPPQVAVRDLDLAVERGEAFGFLGPNGAGKSTTINVLLDYVRPTSGTATVLGMDAQARTNAVHERIGVLPEGYDLWDRLTARKHVRLAARTKGVDVDPGRILERVGLREAIDRPVGGFSTGMTQRLMLGMALVGNPDLLVLDEPTAGLDPNGVRRLRSIIDAELDRGTTVFFSSHVLEQVEAVCDRVGILRDGELVAVDTVAGLREDLGTADSLRLELESGVEDARDAIEAVDGVTEVTSRESTVVVACHAGTAKVAAIDAARDAGSTIVDIDVESTDLETLFASYAGERTGNDSSANEPGGPQAPADVSGRDRADDAPDATGGKT